MSSWTVTFSGQDGALDNQPEIGYRLGRGVNDSGGDGGDDQFAGFSPVRVTLK